ncbi:MAG: STAS domain-containing protein [Bacteroidia bacterium]
MTFSFRIEPEIGVEIVHLSGELIDKGQASELSTSVDDLIESRKIKMVFDLQDLKYINSSGLNVMINILSRVRKAGGEVVITNVSKRVNELLIITKLNTVFTVTETLESAVSKLK